MRLVLILIAILLSTPVLAGRVENGVCFDRRDGWVRCGAGQRCVDLRLRGFRECKAMSPRPR